MYGENGIVGYVRQKGLNEKYEIENVFVKDGLRAKKSAKYLQNPPKTLYSDIKNRLRYRLFNLNFSRKKNSEERIVCNVFSLKNFLSVFCVSALFFAADVRAQAFEKGTNAVGVYYQTYWWVKEGGIMEWNGLTNGGMAVWDYGVVNDALSVGVDLGFNWQTNSNSAEFRLANYSLRAGFHPLGLPGMPGGDTHDLYGLIKLGVVTEWDEDRRDANGAETPQSRFQWSLAIGDRIFIGSNFFFAIELSLRGLAAGLGVAF